MYKFLLGCALSTIVFLTACENDDQKKAAVEITGTWELTEILYTSMVQGVPSKLKEADYTEFFVFYEDGTFVNHGLKESPAPGTYTIEPDKNGNPASLRITFDDPVFHPLYVTVENPDKLAVNLQATDGNIFYYEKVEEVKTIKALDNP